ncbi:hypothetical protein BX666DRAFT_1904050 [Dichotomocladium elegans]|nr:hypothetical protein BX666DRAFT_1904050 [Dichotomocladium elegans]
MKVQGFWGLQVVPGKTYTQVVTAPFRVALAAINGDNAEEGRSVLSITVEKKKFALCTLIHEKLPQQTMDLTFVEGEEVSFSVSGPNTIHLTGNYTFDDEDDESMEEDGDATEDEDDSEMDEDDKNEMLK